MFKIPENAKSFIDRLEGEVFGGRQANPKVCKTCMFVTDPFKSYCKIYERDEEQRKPPGI
jgi:hypothetical protein